MILVHMHNGDLAFMLLDVSLVRVREQIQRSLERESDTSNIIIHVMKRVPGGAGRQGRLDSRTSSEIMMRSGVSKEKPLLRRIMTEY
jgi:hypothetical protein